MGQIIAFPGSNSEALAATAATPLPASAAKPKSLGTVQAIRPRGHIRKENRPEDEETILVGRMARSFADRAYALAQTEPNSEAHRLTIGLARMADQLPRNNLRLFSTPDDARAGLWALSRQVQIANLEWELCDSRRFDAGRGDEPCSTRSVQ